MLEFDNDIPAKDYCGSYAWFDTKKKEQHVFFCGLASCSRIYCQKLFYIKRVRLISDLIKEYSLDRFYQLSMKRDVPRREAWENIPHIWRKARTMLTRRYPNMLFCSVLEANKDGYPHIHGFVNIFIHQREWSKTFEVCGGGSYAWVTKIDVKDGTVEEYVTKELNIARYVGKDQIITARQMAKRRARTFWRSVGMKTEYERKKGEAEKSGVILVKEDVYEETEKGFDKLVCVWYNKKIGEYCLRRIC